MMFYFNSLCLYKCQRMLRVNRLICTHVTSPAHCKRCILAKSSQKLEKFLLWFLKKLPQHLNLTKKPWFIFQETAVLHYLNILWTRFVKLQKWPSPFRATSWVYPLLGVGSTGLYNGLQSRICVITELVTLSTSLRLSRRQRKLSRYLVLLKFL